MLTLASILMNKENMIFMFVYVFDECNCGDIIVFACRQVPVPLVRVTSVRLRVYNKYVVRLLYVSALRQPQFVSEPAEKAAIPVPGSLWADYSGGRAAWRHAHHRESISRMHRAWNGSAEEADLSPPERSRQPLGWRSWTTRHGWTMSA
jgi:hypothetical protein